MTAKMILLNPGPANTTDTVKRAMLAPDICPRERDFGAVLRKVRDEVTRVVHEGDAYTSVLFGGSGTAAVEAAIGAVPNSGRLLVIENGSYGQRMADVAAGYRIAHEVQNFGTGGWPEPAAVAERLDAAGAAGQGFSHLAVVHHETSTGMLNPVPELGALCRARGVSMIVDAMSSYAGLSIDVESMGADYLISSANKCIQGMAGLAFVICRRAVLDALDPQPGRSLYLDLALQHRFFEKTGQLRFTPPVQVVYALEQALTEYFAEDGGRGRHARYQSNFEALDGGMRALGFRRLLPEAQLSRILTAYLEPDNPNYDFEAFHDALYAKGFTIYPGKGAHQATFRLANMGAVTPDEMRAFVNAVTMTVSEQTLAPLYRA